MIIIGWTYGINNFMRDIEFMTGQKVSKMWKFCWKYLTPSILMVSKTNQI